MPTPSRLLKTYAALARWVLGLVLGGWLLLVLAWGALHGWIVPRIDTYRPQIEVLASKAIGVPVRIGDIEARTDGLVPSFTLRNVQLLDKDGRVALRLPQVVAALSPRSLLNYGFEQLYIDRPELDVRRAADGRIFVAGLDFSQGGADDGRAADWFFSQAEIVVNNGTVRWTDELQGADTLALERLTFVARNRGQRHRMRLDATPPTDFGRPFTVQAEFRQPLWTRRAGQWQSWEGQLYADFPAVDVARLHRQVPLGVEVLGGLGGLRLWADVQRGAVTGVTADMALLNAEVQLGERLKPLALDIVSGRFSGSRLATGLEAATQNLKFRTRDGLEWPGGNVALTWTQAEGNAPAQGTLTADRLDLAALSQVASRLPLGTATHGALEALQPKGMVERLQARWKGELDAVQTYQATGRVVGLELAAQPFTGPAQAAGSSVHAGVPGLRGATIDFDLSQAGGKAKLNLVRGALEFPGVFEDPVIAMDTFNSDLTWRIDGRKLYVEVSQMQFANKDMQGQGKFNWRTSDPAQSGGKSRFPGVIDLEGSINRGDGTRVHRYLPLTIHRQAREYVREAVVAGRVNGLKFRVRGDMYDIPFSDPKKGEFRISTQVEDATFAFVPGSYLPAGGLPWPALTAMNGELIFEREGMEVRGASGRLAGAPTLQVLRADAAIADLGHSPTVVVTADTRGPMTEALALVNSSPLADMTGHVLDGATAQGVAGIRLRLALPLNELARSKVNGSITLPGNDLQITPGSPWLGRARGVVNFSETGFSLAGAQARLLGGEMRLEGGSRPASAPPTDPQVMLRAQGTVTAEGMRQAREMGPLAALAERMEGSTGYTASLAIRRGVPEISVASNLQGLALQFPAPLVKAAADVMPLRYDNALVKASEAADAPLIDQLAMQLGQVGTVQFVRDLSGAQPKVLRGTVGLGLLPGESVALPTSGVAANIRLGAVDVDAWEKVFLSMAPQATATRAVVTGPDHVAQDYLPTVLALRGEKITWQGRTLHDLVAGGSRQGLAWRVNLDARELNGYLEYRQPSGNSAGRVFARLARVSIAAGAASDVETLLDEQPASIPALDIVVEDFELRGRNLGRVEVEAVNRGANAVAREGGVREWRLNKLNFYMPEANLSANGNWVALNAQAPTAGAAPVGRTAAAEPRRTVMNFRLDVADAGQLLNRFGMKDVVRKGKGKLEGQVAWRGSPLTLDYPSMTGVFNVNVESGQFLKADPGLAKLLGVLSLQSLPRRLTLDFRDVFSEGFSFDFVRGDVTIQQGVAATNNLQMKGVNAAVLMEGKADIATETQDIKVLVVPEINAGTASLVATVINPLVGLGSFIAQLVLRDPLIKANTQEFHIDGTWADPRITRLDRKSVAPPQKGNTP